MKKLSFIPKEEMSKEKQEVYGITENTVNRLLYIINSQKVITNEEVNLDLLRAARNTLNVAIVKQQEVVKNNEV